MPANTITDVDEFTEPMTSPGTGQTANQATFLAGLQGAANRTRNLKNRVDALEEEMGAVSPGTDGQFLVTFGSEAVWSNYVTINSIGEDALSALGLGLRNTSAASGGSDQFSPDLLFEGRYWDGDSSEVMGTLVQQRTDGLTFAATDDQGATETLLAKFDADQTQILSDIILLGDNSNGARALFLAAGGFNLMLMNPNGFTDVGLTLYQQASGPAIDFGVVGGLATPGETAGTVYMQGGLGDSATNGNAEVRGPDGTRRIWLDGDANPHIDIPNDGNLEILEGSDSILTLYRSTSTLLRLQVRGAAGWGANDLEFQQEPVGTTGNGYGFILTCSDADTGGFGGGVEMNLGDGAGEGGPGVFVVKASDGTELFLVDPDEVGTAFTLVDNSGGTPSLTFAALPTLTDSPATADALRDDLNTNAWPVFKDWMASAIARIQDLETQLETMKVLQ